MTPTGYPAEDILSRLSPQERQTLVSLPYRAGLFVSFADVTGGWDAQERELQSLTGILRQFSQEHFQTEFPQKILMETLHERSRWPAWSQSIENVPAEAEGMVGTLAPILSEDELEDFKDILVDIALAVAMAFRERETGQPEEEASTGAGVRAILARLVGARTEADPLSHMNVSISERRAVLHLAKALQYTKLQRQ